MTNRTLTTAVAACLVVVAVLLWRASAPAPETHPKAVAAQAPAAVLPPMPSPPEPPEPAPPLPVAEAVPVPPPAAPDPQLDLHTAMNDLAAMWRAGDFMGAFMRYTPPARLAALAAKPATMKAIEESMALARVPGTPNYQDLQPQIQTLDLARDMKLFLKETGDTATYTLTNEPFDRVVLSFVKVDGKWYRGGGNR